MRLRTAPLIALVALGFSVTPDSARADAVPPAPRDCPPGTRGDTDHYGPHCAPSTCNKDEDCTSGQLCRPVSLCVLDKIFESSRGDTHRLEAKGECGPEQSCPDGTECQTAKRCAEPDAKADPTPTPTVAEPPAKKAEPETPAKATQDKGGSGCSIGGAPLFGLAFVLLFLRRRDD